MGKMVGMAEFKANCTRLLREVAQDGVAITVTVRGKPVAVVNAPAPKDVPVRSAIGFLKNDRYRFDRDPELPAGNPEDWEALK